MSARTEIVAEIGPNHNGKLVHAIRLIDAAKEAGADYVKFQAYTADELIALRGDGPAPEPWASDGWTMRSLYDAARTPLEWFPTLADYCEMIGIGWFASVFGPESLAALEDAGCPRYKLAAMEWGNADLLEMVRATGKPVVRSCPTLPADTLDGFVSALKETGDDDLELYCPPGYPQRTLNLRHVQWFDGFSYHDNDPEVPAFAVAAGARMIEAHIHLEHQPSRFEAAFAFTPGGFAEMVQKIRRVEGWL